jgi:hypothetical protein
VQGRERTSQRLDLEQQKQHGNCEKPQPTMDTCGKSINTEADNLQRFLKLAVSLINVSLW